MALDAMIGYGAWLGLRLEATWGTSAGDPTQWLQVMSVVPKVDLGITVVPYLGHANGQVYHAARDHVQTLHDVTLEVTGCCSYDSNAFTMLLVHAFGAVATTGTNPYTHAITLDTDAIVGITCHVVKGTGLASPCETYTGGRITRLKVSVNARGWATYTATILCKQAGGATTLLGTPTYAATEELMAHHAGVFAWSGNSVYLRSFSFTIDNNLQRRPYIGSLYTDVPVPGGHASITWEAERSWEDHDLYADYLAVSQGDATYTFTGTSPNSFALTLHNAVLSGPPDMPIDKAGELTQRFSGIALADGTDLGAKITIINANSSAV